jgi:hypothetical protein
MAQNAGFEVPACRLDERPENTVPGFFPGNVLHVAETFRGELRTAKFENMQKVLI